MKKNTLTKAYNDTWREKIMEKNRLDSQKRVLGAFSSLFQNILKRPFLGNIIDIGCGDGALVEVLNKTKGVKAQGIDISDDVDFESDALPYADNEFDIAIMYSVIEHINNPGNILFEIKRILKKQGILLVITSNFDLAHPLICDREFYYDPTHIHPYNTRGIEYLMQIYHFDKKFIGLWTVGKSQAFWKLPPKLQFYIGALLPFRGNAKIAPTFLKGKSKTMLCVFENVK